MGEVGNLPTQLTRLVGREAQLRDLSTALWDTRLLTLCGPGGVGKTRLAVALGEVTRADFLGGVWWVDLSATRESGLVAQTFGTALLPGEAAVDFPSALLGEHFAEPSLIVLDNCEQVIDGCAELAREVLRQSPAFRLIATSRQPLGVPGERVWRVPGLSTSVSDQPDDDAVALFLQRARESGASDLETPEALIEIRRICAELEGLPLALELAAARVRLLGVSQIAERLASGSDFLKHSDRHAPERHRTLRQTLDWSHDLLTPVESVLLRRLSVFRGSFSLSAAEQVCADEGLNQAEVLDVLGALVDQSLVGVLDDRPERRYRLPETIRRYASERLELSHEQDAIRDGHARFFAAMAPAESPTGEPTHQLELLELEHDNVREAMNWLLGHRPPDAAALAQIVWPFLHRRGYYDEARLWFRALLASQEDLTPPVRARVLLGAGEVAFLQCDYPEAAEHLHGVLALVDEIGDAPIRAAACTRLGSIAREQGDYEQALEWHERSRRIWTGLGDERGVAICENHAGFVAWLRGDCAAAEALCSPALAVLREAGAPQDSVGALVNLGGAALYSGNLALARERLEEALAISRRHGFQEGIAWSLHELAILSRHGRGQVSERAEMLRDALLVHHRLGDRWRLVSVLEEVAGSLLGREAARPAGALFAYSEALRERLGAPIPPVESPDHAAAVARVQSRLGIEGSAAARAQGRAWELSEAVARAVDAIDEVRGPRDGAAGLRTPVLTARELAVLELLSRGDTNREIATALYISPSTAGVHVSNILRKLGAKRRVDAAGAAHRLGLVAVD